MATEPNVLQAGRRIGDRYVIVDVLGAGAMGVVYRARHERLQRDVALKVLSLAPSAQVVAYFEREGVALAKLRHPSIVEVYDAGECDGVSWLAMELLSGETLGDAIRRATRLDASELAFIGPALADGVAAAHQAGVLHRDLKPDNIFLAQQPGEHRRTKIVDFGVASLAGDRCVEFVGTMYYAAPEIVAELGWSPAADIWSLGVTLFHAVTGVRPFRGETLPELATAIARDPIPQVQDFGPVPPWLADAIMACLVRDPAQRPGALELARMLRCRPKKKTLPPDDTGERAAVEPPRTNLPAPEPFVGREREIVALREALGAERLVTLVGPGGTGKTRLAIEVGRLEAPSVSGGTWLCDLSSATNPSDIAEVVARAMGHPLLSEPEPVRQVAVTLASRGGCLLVLDGFERLTAHTEVLEGWLDAAPALRVLVTSRTVLRAKNEHLVEIEPLDPAAGARLLIERAARTGTRLRGEDARFVDSIVRSVDAIPLAIELAAARLSAMSPRQLAERLGTTPGASSSPGRSSAFRQGKLRAVIDASWSALAAPEQRLLSRCSVFAGGWSLESAEAVAGVDCGEVVEKLQSLKDQSMIRIARNEEGEVRFSMLGMLREYAAERLFEAGEAEPTRALHARHMIAWAERTTSFDPDFAARAHLLVEVENILAAADASGPDQALRGVLALEPVLSGLDPFQFVERIARLLEQVEDEVLRMRGRLAVARVRAAANPADIDELMVVAERAGELGLAGLRAQALVALGDGDFIRKDTQRMGDRVEEALRIAPPAIHPVLLVQRAAWHLREGRPQEAGAAIDEALAELGPGVDARLRAYRVAALVATSLRDHERVEQYTSRALEMAERLGDRRMLAILLNSRGVDKLDLGHLAEAKELLGRAIRHARETGQRAIEGNATGNLGMLAAIEGDLPAARGYLSATARVAAELRVYPGLALMLGWLGWIAAAEGRLDLAADQFALARSTASDSAEGAVAARVIELLSRQLDLARSRGGDPVEARRVQDEIEREVQAARRADSDLRRMAARRMAKSLGYG